MGRVRKITPETIAEVVKLLCAVPVLSKGEVVRKLCAKFSVSERTAATIIKLGKDQIAAGEVAQEQAAEAGELFPTAEVVMDQPALLEVSAAQKLYGTENLPDKDQVRKIVKAENLNILCDPNEYAKNKTAAAKNLIQLYKLDEEDVDREQMTPEQSDQELARALADLFMLPKDKCQFLPEYAGGEE